MWKEFKAANQLEKIKIVLSGMIFFSVFAALSIFIIFFMDNLMHSDMSAEVILSKLLCTEHKLITKDWYYSTEIRILYSHLIMTPLFYLFGNYTLVKQLSVFIFYGILIWAYLYLMKRVDVALKWKLVGLGLLFAPLSNEYLDMQLVGCFYTAQTICTYVFLSLFLKKQKNQRAFYIRLVGLFLFGIFLGLSGLRYLASLLLPLCMALFFLVCTEKEKITKKSLTKQPFKEELSLALLSFCGLFGGAIGFLINKYYLANHYHFDTTSEISFVPLSEVSQRFLNSMKLMLEFVGYTQIQATSPRGMVNVIKLAFLIFMVIATVWLLQNRAKLNRNEKLLLFYTLAAFLFNWYLLVFTDVLMQYRYWLPIYILLVFVMVLFFKHFEVENQLIKITAVTICVAAVLGSLYGELWQDMKYNDCEKRYAYMNFLEKEGYDFGYATFWNASVSEYLSNGQIQFANLGLNDLEKPYEWLVPTYYYERGYHRGKCFLLLANSEAAGMEKGDFTIMEDAQKVYQDEYYSIYEGNEGMYLFTEG